MHGVQHGAPLGLAFSDGLRLERLSDLFSAYGAAVLVKTAAIVVAGSANICS